MAASRSHRRHHEERLKSRWRERMRRWLGIFAVPPKAEHVERLAVRRAHHSKCPCDLCKRERYHRPAEKRRATEEGGGAP